MFEKLEQFWNFSNILEQFHIPYVFWIVLVLQEQFYIYI